METRLKVGAVIWRNGVYEFQETGNDLSDEYNFSGVKINEKFLAKLIQIS